jgi:hypothetical protein
LIVKTRFILMGSLMLSILLASCQTSPPDSEGDLGFSRSRMVFNAGGDIPSDTRMVTVTNAGSGSLTVTDFTLTGEDAAQFSVASDPISLSAGESAELSVTFTPSAADLGPQTALLEVAGGGSSAEVALGGLSVLGQEGTREPSLQWIFDTFGLPIDAGDSDPTDSALTDGIVAAPVGDGVVAATFERADPAAPVTVEVLAAFGVADVAPVYAFGYYDASETEPELQELFEVPIAPNLNGQRLEPLTTPSVAEVEDGIYSFTPPSESFGFYSFWPTTRFFDARNVFTEDTRNTFENSAPFQVRAYPLVDESGSAVPNAYILATDESARLFDYNDSVVIVRNVSPLGD